VWVSRDQGYGEGIISDISYTSRGTRQRNTHLHVLIVALREAGVGSSPVVEDLDVVERVPDLGGLGGVPVDWLLVHDELEISLVHHDIKIIVGGRKNV
jgi:hypothetical protein